jgi:hypothetical protein
MNLRWVYQNQPDILRAGSYDAATLKTKATGEYIKD